MLVYKDLVANESAFIQVMAWRLPVEKPLREKM